MKHVFLLLFLLLAACTQAPDPVVIPLTSPKPVIFDGDMAHEDMFAALFLLQHPNVDVKAITVVGTGETHCAPGVENVRGLVALANRPEIPVVCGREIALVGNHAFPEEWRRGADSAYGVSLPVGSGPVLEMHAPELIAQIVRESPEPVTIVATGPLTNIAETVLDHADIVPKIAMIYVMGGAVEVEGNVGGTEAGVVNELAEWNIYIDPAAANTVLASGTPVTLVPLDATSHVPVTRQFFATLGRWKATPAARFVYDVLAVEMAFVESGSFHFWDSFTAAVATDENLAKIEEREIVVVEEEGPESGWTKATHGGFPVRVAVWADAERYEALLLTVLNGETNSFLPDSNSQ